MPFLPPKQQRQSTEGSALTQYTTTLTHTHLAEIFNVKQVVRLKEVIIWHLKYCPACL